MRLNSHLRLAVKFALAALKQAVLRFASSSPCQLSLWWKRCKADKEMKGCTNPSKIINYSVNTPLE